MKNPEPIEGLPLDGETICAPCWAAGHPCSCSPEELGRILEDRIDAITLNRAEAADAWKEFAGAPRAPSRNSAKRHPTRAWRSRLYARACRALGWRRMAQAWERAPELSFDSFVDRHGQPIRIVRFTDDDYRSDEIRERVRSLFASSEWVKPNPRADR